MDGNNDDYMVYYWFRVIDMTNKSIQVVVILEHGFLYM